MLINRLQDSSELPFGILFARSFFNVHKKHSHLTVRASIYGFITNRILPYPEVQKVLRR